MAAMLDDVTKVHEEKQFVVIQHGGYDVIQHGGYDVTCKPRIINQSVCV
jgi:hypothetical protein